ncbi:MAG: putative signal transduction protein, partial [Frankiales bacterium]|nr:putative signal transduction protein [Frankiales bacterium]
MSDVVTASPLVGPLVEQLETLPASRVAALRVVRVVDDPEASAAQVARAASADPALTARLMRLANSAYYGLSGRVRTPAFAVTVVGFATVRSLAGVAAAGLAGPDDLPPGFWVRAASVASGAALLAARTGAQEPEVFCLGLLHDLGSALLRQHDRRRHDDVVLQAKGRDDLLLRAEQATYGGTHATLCAQVLATWNFPPDLCAAVAEHHAPPVRTAPPLRRALQGGIDLADLAAGARQGPVLTAALA